MVGDNDVDAQAYGQVKAGTLFALLQTCRFQAGCSRRCGTTICEMDD